MTDADRDSFITNIVGHMEDVPLRIKLGQCAIFYLSDKDYGERVAKGLKLNLEHVRKLAGMTQYQRVAETANL
jgi:catalase